MTEFGYSLQVNTNIIPLDDTTLFVCSGMQNLKDRFRNPDGSKLATLQSCIRTNDLELVGDGTHLTYFEMLGNFHFSLNNEYEYTIDLWTAILHDLGIVKDCIVHVHPDDWNGKRILWKYGGFQVQPDPECIWSDGDIGGTCCEIYWKGIEIGNLVNPLGTMTDVGFGYERLLMVVEGKNRVDETSLFDQSLPPVCRDHERTLNCLWQNGVEPGNKKRNYVTRRLLRRMLRYDLKKNFIFQEWLESEKELRDKCLKIGKKLWKKHKDKSPQWWWSTCGLTQEELEMLTI